MRAFAYSMMVNNFTPLVDTQNVRRQSIVNEELLATLPTRVKSPNALIGVTLGLLATAVVIGRGWRSAPPGTEHSR